VGGRATGADHGGSERWGFLGSRLYRDLPTP
jgi:hypothetical protein